MKSKPVPSKVNLQWHAFKNDLPFDQIFDYHSAIGKLNCLDQTTRPDVMYATHQAAKYSSIPRLTHGEATLYIVQYLKKTPDLMLKFKPKSDKGFECYCDADFAEN